MISRVIVLLLLALLGQPASAQIKFSEPVVQHQFDTPEKDAAIALRNGDLSLRGVYRFVEMVPGISGDYIILSTKFKIKMIENTSDVIIVNNPKSYNNMAEQYAFAYNRFLFSKLGCDPEYPMCKCKSYTPSIPDEEGRIPDEKR